MFASNVRKITVLNIFTSVGCRASIMDNFDKISANWVSAVLSLIGKTNWYSHIWKQISPWHADTFHTLHLTLTLDIHTQGLTFHKDLLGATALGATALRAYCKNLSCFELVISRANYYTQGDCIGYWASPRVRNQNLVTRLENEAWVWTLTRRCLVSTLAT